MKSKNIRKGKKIRKLPFTKGSVGGRRGSIPRSTAATVTLSRVRSSCCRASKKGRA